MLRNIEWKRMRTDEAYRREKLREFSGWIVAAISVLFAVVLLIFGLVQANNANNSYVAAGNAQATAQAARTAEAVANDAASDANQRAATAEAESEEALGQANTAATAVAIAEGQRQDAINERDDARNERDEAEEQVVDLQTENDNLRAQIPPEDTRPELAAGTEFFSSYPDISAAAGLPINTRYTFANVHMTVAGIQYVLLETDQNAIWVTKGAVPLTDDQLFAADEYIRVRGITNELTFTNLITTDGEFTFAPIVDSTSGATFRLHTGDVIIKLAEADGQYTFEPVDMQDVAITEGMFTVPSWMITGENLPTPPPVVAQPTPAAAGNNSGNTDEKSWHYARADESFNHGKGDRLLIVCTLSNASGKRVGQIAVQYNPPNGGRSTTQWTNRNGCTEFPGAQDYATITVLGKNLAISPGKQRTVFLSYY